MYSVFSFLFFVLQLAWIRWSEIYLLRTEGLFHVGLMTKPLMVNSLLCLVLLNIYLCDLIIYIYRVKLGVSAIRKCCGNLMVQNSVAFPRDGFDGKRVRWKWRHCFVFPQRFRWLKRVSSFPLRFRKRFCYWNLLVFMINPRFLI